MIWSSLQLTSKQWIITQQFTAGADLFLKQNDVSLPQFMPVSQNAKITFQSLDGSLRYVIVFGLRFYVPVNSNGHVETVSLPKHTFSWAI